ncbi:hypothetical protein [Bradyrhizobium sp. STM 3809]|uniref:hypothetical protein n=1 Tax=Bradyrhizobium sp. STM 3809 TaxID=551936 RepID=UPI000240925E|nr:hypothetical protein [Bradyrhizobium sp. STM 3809]CCE00660.1 hypothetical protein BRAS3809_360003 [Bradyrhizobium sp. STM 3809]
MAFFTKTDPAAKSQRDLESKLKAKRTSRDDLTERRKAAEAAAAVLREKAVKLASDGGDDAALSAAEAAMRREQDRVATLTEALANIDSAIANLEREIASLVDQRCRAETAAAVTAIAKKWRSAGAAFDASLDELVQLARESAIILPDAEPLRVFLEAVQQQVGPEASMITGVLEGHAKAVLAGTAPASLPKPVPPEPVRVVERPLTERMFAMRAVRWHDVNGVERVCDQYEFADVTPSAAQNGRACGAVVDVTDPRCGKLRGAHGGRHPNPQLAFDLDNERDRPQGDQSGIDPVLRSASFRVIDRSAEERTLTIAVPRV